MNQRQEPDQGVLYLIGTPIGNLQDLSPRAKHILREVSAIACEDTRRSHQMLKRLEVKNTLFSFHRHNSQKQIPKIINLLTEGKSIGLISDAGLPGISDPGEQLVKETIHKGLDVICIPGPCAAITALVSSGMPSERFCFEGFLPQKGKKRKQRLLEIGKEKRTSIIYEAPHRLIKLLEELVTYCGEERPLSIARELTKLHEEKISSSAKNALKHFRENPPLGEFTIVLGGFSEEVEEYSDSELKARMNILIKQGSTNKEASQQVSIETGLSKRFLYSLLHQNKEKKSLN